MIRASKLSSINTTLPSAPQRWVARGRGFAAGTPKREARLQLFCFHYAGAGASQYASWQKKLPDEIDVWCVELPGRQSRYAEPPARRLEPVARDLAHCIAPVIRGEYALLGCSLGAHVAFEVARALRRMRQPGPSKLVVLAANPPRTEPASTLHQLSDDALLEAMARLYQPIAPELLAKPVLRKQLLHVLRADLEMAETYSPAAESPLSCPILFLSGTHDRTMARDAAAGWRSQTQADFEYRTIAGGHLFIDHARDVVLCQVERYLSK